MIAGVTMRPDACFSADYGQARQRFVTRAGEAGGTLVRYDHALRGPRGEDLACDAAWFGPMDAAAVLVLVCATHGVEGFSGSAAQLDWLDVGGPASLPPGVAALLVHALNPWGFAWLRRTTEDGVDLNRNCVDFAAGVPANEGYAALADAFVPRALDKATLAEARERLASFRDARGARTLQAARSSGQHTHPDGLFYGGVEPTWSRDLIGTLARDFRLADRRGVAVIDYHTGLGSWGHGEPICGHRPGTSGQARCRAWYGDSLGEPLLGTSASLPITGLTQYEWARQIGDEALTFVALEFGTFPVEVGDAALRDEHWLHAHGGLAWDDPRSQAIKFALKRFYHPDTPDWRELVLLRSRQVIGQACSGLAHPRDGRSA